MQPADKKRTQAMTHEQQMKQRELMKQPINRFMSQTKEVDCDVCAGKGCEQCKEGKIFILKYPIAEKIRRWNIANPDPLEDSIRMSFALYHEVLHRKNLGARLFKEAKGEIPIESRDQKGNLMTQEECYQGYVSETVNVLLALSRLRHHLIGNLLNKCGPQELVTFDMFNSIALDLSKKIEKEGLMLFPDKVVIPAIE